MQGKSLTEEEVANIGNLLAETEMTLFEISERTGCSRSVLVTINRKLGIRDYAGLRSTWKLKPQPQEGGMSA